MKALLTLALILSTTYIVSSQVLYEENFEAYTPGSIIGQTNFDYVDGLNASFNVIQDEQGQHLRINSGILYKNLTLWPSRNVGNDVIEVAFDYFTGDVSNILSIGGILIYVYSPGGDYEIIGIMMHSNSKVVVGAYHYWGHPGFIEQSLGDEGASVVLPENQWVRLAFSFNPNTNEAMFSGPGFAKKFDNYFVYNYGHNSISLEYEGYYGADSYYDNVVVKAVPSSTLGTQEPFPMQSGLQLYPNPVTDYVIVETEDMVIGAYIYDVYGKRSEVMLQDGKIDVSHFPTGSYIIGLKTDKGFVSQKIIKR